MEIFKEIGSIIVFLLIIFVIRLFIIRYDKIFKNSEKIEHLEQQNEQILEELKQLRKELKNKP